MKSYVRKSTKRYSNIFPGKGEHMKGITNEELLGIITEVNERKLEKVFDKIRDLSYDVDDALARCTRAVPATRIDRLTKTNLQLRSLIRSMQSYESATKNQKSEKVKIKGDGNKVKVTIRMEPQDLEIIDKYAIRNGLTRSVVIRQVLRNWVKENTPTMNMKQSKLIDELVPKTNHNPKPMLKCGHTANAVDGEGKPACAICGCTEKGEEPFLAIRKARCECGKIVSSKMTLPFFRHCPDKEYDSYYCGCWGWD